MSGNNFVGGDDTGTARLIGRIVDLFAAGRDLFGEVEGILAVFV